MRVLLGSESMLVQVFRLISRPTLAAALLWLLPFSGSSQVSPSALLDGLHARDDASSKGFSMALQARIPAHPFDLGQGTAIKTCQVTNDGASQALKCDYRYPRDPVYRASDVLGYGPVDYDLNSNLILWRETKKHGLSAADNNSSYVELDMHRVDKAGGVIEKISYVQLQRYRPGDADNLYEISHIFMALGGGFSEHLERITETKALRSGSLHVVAQGSYGPTLRGTWKLVVDPEADYLVQNASFVKDGTSEPLLTFESSGIFRAAGVPALARRGVMRRRLRADFVYEISVELQSYVPGPDPRLLDEARKRVTSALPDGAEIIDLSSQPPSRRFIGTR